MHEGKPHEEHEVIVHGGPEERSTEEHLKSPKQFPTDYEPFFPDRNPEETVERSLRLQQQRKREELPKDLQGFEVLVEPVSINGRTLCKVTSTFQQDNDPGFAGANLWIKGYMTNNALADYDENNPGVNETGVEETIPFQKLATVTRSPHSIYLEATSEKVIMGVEAINKEGIGSGLETMPVQTFELI